MDRIGSPSDVIAIVYRKDDHSYCLTFRVDQFIWACHRLLAWVIDPRLDFERRDCDAMMSAMEERVKEVGIF